MGRKKKVHFEEPPSLDAFKKDIIEDPVDEYQYYRGDKNVPKSEAKFEWTPKMVQELKKCKEDIVYFAENYFYIVNLDRGKEVIKLYTRQRQILRSLIANRNLVLLSCRQAGKCFSKDTVIKLRNKKTGEIKEVTAEELFNKG